MRALIWAGHGIRDFEQHELGSYNSASQGSGERLGAIVRLVVGIGKREVIERVRKARAHFLGCPCR